MDGYWLAREVMTEGNVGAGGSVAGGFALPALLDFVPTLVIVVSILYGPILAAAERFACRHSDATDRASIFTALLPFTVFFAVRSPQTSIIVFQTCAAVALPFFLMSEVSPRHMARSSGTRPYG